MDLCTYSSVLILVDVEKRNWVKRTSMGWDNSMERGDKGLLKGMK